MQNSKDQWSNRCCRVLYCFIYVCIKWFFDSGTELHSIRSQRFVVDSGISKTLDVVLPKTHTWNLWKTGPLSSALDPNVVYIQRCMCLYIKLLRISNLFFKNMVSLYNPGWYTTNRVAQVFHECLCDFQVRWMMYWIVFALYTVIETVADQTLAW